MRLDLFAVIGHATLLNQLICLVLALLALACVGLCFAKILAAPRLAGGSTFLASARWGGPLLGLAGAVWAGVRASLGMANVEGVTLHQLGPAFAEAGLVLALGLLAGVVAIAANWAVEARLDRAVLRAR